MALYDKVTADSFFSGRFNDDDLQIFSHFVGYVERALTAIDPAVEQDVPDVDAWRARIGQELARAGERAGALALAVCSIEEIDGETATSEQRATAALTRVEAALRSELRPFDLMVRLDERRLGVLLPEPGTDAAAHVRSLARGASERLQSQDAAQPGPRITLGFGFAVNEAGEQDAQALEARASDPRILMV